MSPWLFCCTAYCSHSAKNSRTKYFYLSSLLTMRFFDWDVSVGFHEASFLKAILQVCYLGDKNLWSTWCGKAKNWWWLPAKSHQRKKNMSVQENEYFFRLHAFFKIFFGLFPDVEIILCHTILAFTMTNDHLVAQNFSIFRPYLGWFKYWKITLI